MFYGERNQKVYNIPKNCLFEMEDLELIVKQFTEDFQGKGIVADANKRVLDFNVYLANHSLPYLKHGEFTKILIDVKQRFEDVFDLSFDYKFFSAPEVGPAIFLLLDRINKGIIVKYFDGKTTKRIDRAEFAKIEAMYYSMNDISRSLYDYDVFFQANGYKKKSGLDCVISGLEGLSAGGRQVGVAAFGADTFVLGISNREKEELEKTMLHEISHCFGADHTYFPLSIMSHNTQCVLRWWDPFSKYVVKKGIERYLSQD